MNKETPHPTIPRKRKRVRRWLTRLLWFVGLVPVIGTLMLLAIEHYVKAHQQEIFAQLLPPSSAEVQFGVIDFSFFRHFPKATLSVTDVYVADSTGHCQQQPFLQAGQLEVVLGVHEVGNRKIHLEEVLIQDAAIDLQTEPSGKTNLQYLLDQLHFTSTRDSNTLDLDVEWRMDELSVSVYNSQFRQRNEQRFRDLKVEVREASVALQLAQDTSFVLQVNSHVPGLGFNTQKGVYLTDSDVNGQIEGTWCDQVLHLSAPILSINGDAYDISAILPLGGSGVAELDIANRAIDYLSTLNLLPATIRNKLSDYYIGDSFSATARITFPPQRPTPLVSIDYFFPSNPILVKGIVLANTTGGGTFYNHLYDDQRTLRESRKNFRLQIDSLRTQLDSFPIQVYEGEIFVSPSFENYATGQLTATGNNRALGQFMGSKKFVFQKGTFQLQANMRGQLANLKSFLLQSAASLRMNDIAVRYRPSAAVFRFDELDLQKRSGTAYFSLTGVTPVEDSPFVINGDIINLERWLLSENNEPSQTQAQLVTPRTSWEDMLLLLSKQNAYTNKQSLKETLRGLQQNFDPVAQLVLDTVFYGEQLQFLQLSTAMRYAGENTIILDSTRFDIEGGSVLVAAKVDISDSLQTDFELNLTADHLNLERILPKVNYFNVALLQLAKAHSEDLSLQLIMRGTIDDQKGLIPQESEIELSFAGRANHYYDGVLTIHSDDPERIETTFQLCGHPSLINEFIHSDNFFFQDGEFIVDFTFAGNPRDPRELISESDVRLEVSNSSLYYRATDITFPLTQLQVDLKDDVATYDFYLAADSLQQSLRMKGTFDQLADYLLPDTTQQIHHVAAEIYAPRLVWDDLKDVFTDKKKTGRTLEASLRSLLNTFNPDLSIAIDTLVYSPQLTVHRLAGGLHLDDLHTFHLEGAGFDFHRGRLSLDGHINFADTLQTPFDFRLRSTRFDLAGLLEQMDYFHITALQQVETLQGTLELDAQFAGRYDNRSRQLLPDATDGLVRFNLHDTEVKGLGLIDTIAQRLFMRKRFSDVRFAPIGGEITIRGRRLEVPLIEVQSNAVHCFIEGTLDPDSEEHLWIAIPLANLKRVNRKAIPQKTGYVMAGRMLYLTLLPRPDNSTQLKFRWTKRRFFKERGLDYKSFRKRLRRERKGLRRESRRQQRGR